MVFGTKRGNYTKEPKNECTKVKEAFEYANVHLDIYEYNKRKFTRKTGCQIPCQYTEYNIVDYELIEKEYDAIFIKFASDEIDVEIEEFMYDWISFIAECGGALGLFLGFSFMTILDMLTSCKNFMAKIIKKI